MASPLDYDFEALLSAIAAGIVTTDELPVGLYMKTVEYLNKGVVEGWEMATSYLPDEELLAELQSGIYEFSAAKTYQSVSQLQNLSKLLVKEGRIASYSEFRQGASKVLDAFYDNYLQTEYNTAIGQAQNARKWSDFEQDKANFDYLVYDAIIDPNTSDICRPLDGIKLPVDDPFWNTHSPLNHFNCRCLLRKENGGRKTSKADVKKAYDATIVKMDDTFKMNPGKAGQVFTKKHPYYDVPKKDKSKIKDNFGLPKPPKPTKE